MNARLTLSWPAEGRLGSTVTRCDSWAPAGSREDVVVSEAATAPARGSSACPLPGAYTRGPGGAVHTWQSPLSHFAPVQLFPCLLLSTPNPSILLPSAKSHSHKKSEASRSIARMHPFQPGVFYDSMMLWPCLELVRKTYGDDGHG